MAKAPRLIQHHVVPGMNEALVIECLDEPGHGGACHDYVIRSHNGCVCPRDEEGECNINFQNGPIKEVGSVNGVSIEALTAIIIDRLEGFQSGAYACDTNQAALHSYQAALHALQSRTHERLARGVEGTNKL